MAKGIIAYTTIETRQVGDSLGKACVLTFTGKSAWREDVVAHEACHCAMDEDVIGPYGYEGLSPSEIKLREKAVGDCADRVQKEID